MRPSRWQPSAFRRTCPPAIEQLTINGTVITGPDVKIDSPMLTATAPNQVNIDNGNVTVLTPALNITGPDAALNNSAQITLDQNSTMLVPSNPIEGEKLTFIIIQGALGPFTLAWTGGAGGFVFANAASPQGVKLTDFNTLLAACPANSRIRVGFEYHLDADSWDCVALAGYWP